MKISIWYKIPLSYISGYFFVYKVIYFNNCGYMIQGRRDRKDIFLNYDMSKCRSIYNEN
jgi:hypothetical protein